MFTFCNINLNIETYDPNLLVITNGGKELNAIISNYVVTFCNLQQIFINTFMENTYMGITYIFSEQNDHNKGCASWKLKFEMIC